MLLPFYIDQLLQDRAFQHLYVQPEIDAAVGYGVEKTDKHKRCSVCVCTAVGDCSLSGIAEREAHTVGESGPQKAQNITL